MTSQLTGWKEIAAHLGRGVRTAQRWERHFGMPVHRSGQGPFEIVVADPAEIDAWLATSSVAKKDGRGDGSVVRPSARPRRLAGWIATSVVIVASAVVVWRVSARYPPSAAAGTEGVAATSAPATYHLDEGSGTVLRDSGGGSAHGVVTNGAWTEGRAGKALDFAPGHGTGEHMMAVFPGAFPFHAPATDASLAFWMRPVDTTHRTLFWTRGDTHGPDANRFHIYSGGAQRVIGPALGIDYVSPEGSFHLLFEVPVPVGAWTHVALVRVGAASYTLYLNGERAATHEDANPQLPTYSADWALWRTQDNPYPKQNGALDEISLWRRALSAREVKALAR